MSEIAESPDPVAVGTVLAGKYRIDEKLGGGGMGVVYRAADISDNKDLPRAIKFIKSDHLRGDDRILVRFEREAVGLNHPNLIRIFEIRHYEGLPYIVMELIPGYSLHSLLKQRKDEHRGPMPQEQVLDILRQVLEALRHLHESDPPIIHRDIKPSNIMLIPREDGTHAVKLIDLGIAKRTGSKAVAENLTGIITENTLIGTPDFAAPEQFGGEAVIQSDLYATAVCAYQALTLKLPVTPSGTKEVTLKDWYAAKFHAARNRAVPPVSSVTRSASSGWDRILDRGLAFDVADRFATAREFLQALDVLSLRTPRPWQLLLPSIGAAAVILGVLLWPWQIRAPEGMVVIPDTEVLDPGGRTVRVAGFSVQAAEVTNAEYAEFVRQEKGSPPPDWGGPGPQPSAMNWPVTGVTLDEARRYAEWKARTTGLPVRLIAPEEWEAARRWNERHPDSPLGGLLDSNTGEWTKRQGKSGGVVRVCGGPLAEVHPAAREPWLGIRCVSDPPPRRIWERLTRTASR